MTRADDDPRARLHRPARLDGRRFVVLGAGQGIGRQATHALAARRRPAASASTSSRTAPTDIAAEVDGVAGSGDATDARRLGAPVRRGRGGDGRHRRRGRHHRHVALRAAARHRRRELGLAPGHRPAPRLPRDAVRRPGPHRSRRRVDGVRRLGVGHQPARRRTPPTARPRPV